MTFFVEKKCKFTRFLVVNLHEKSHKFKRKNLKLNLKLNLQEKSVH